MKQTRTIGTQNGIASDDAKSCPICNDTGLEYIPDGGQGGFRVCRCGLREKEIMQRRLAFASVPESFKGLRLDSFSLKAYKSDRSKETAKRAYDSVKAWLANFDEMQNRGMGLYLYSATKGSGKTRMAISVANELMYRRGIQVKFCTSLQILNEIKSSWDKDSKYAENTLLEHLSTTDVLVIDDFGVERGDKSWINDRFYQIINNRYVEKKITIFTSNSKLDLLNYDERITNRIKEFAYQIAFPEESVRDIIAMRNAAEMQRMINGA